MSKQEYKYSFFDLKKQSVPLPEDCNKDALDIADQIKDESLKKDILHAQERKWYGPLYVYDIDGKMKCYFEFGRGVMIRGRLIKRMTGNNEFHLNIKNNMVSFSNKEKDVENV